MIKGRLRLEDMGICEPWFYLGAILSSLSTWRTRTRVSELRTA